MMRSWLLSLCASLLLTLAIELSFALLCRKRGRALGLAALVNGITNPVVVSLAFLWRYYHLPACAALVAAAELAAVLAEGCLYRSDPESFPRPFLFSLAANGLSFGMGLLLGAVQ